MVVRHHVSINSFTLTNQNLQNKTICADEQTRTNPHRHDSTCCTRSLQVTSALVPKQMAHPQDGVQVETAHASAPSARRRPALLPGLQAKLCKCRHRISAHFSLLPQHQPDLGKCLPQKQCSLCTLALCIFTALIISAPCVHQRLGWRGVLKDQAAALEVYACLRKKR
jgi:hypothetical protein